MQLNPDEFPEDGSIFNVTSADEKCSYVEISAEAENLVSLLTTIFIWHSYESKTVVLREKMRETV